MTKDVVRKGRTAGTYWAFSPVIISESLRQIIFSGGENISSVEVEGALLRHPAVQEVAIVGMPDERWGEAPHAFVVLEAGVAATETELRN